MNTYYKCAHLRNHPDLFDWLAERELREADPAARRIAFHYQVSIYHARVIARLAGLGEQSR
jgi:hypothetical protein